VLKKCDFFKKSRRVKFIRNGKEGKCEKKIGRKTYRKLTKVRMEEKLILKPSQRNITSG
jgi:hypothetical protein